MSDLTPPPDRPLPDHTRARMRADLVAAAQGSAAASRGPRWLVPASAAAAVVLVAGVVGWAVGQVGDEAAPVPALATASSAATPASPAPAPPTEPQAVETVYVGSGSCPQELRTLLRGADEALGAEPFSFWVRGDRYAVCYLGTDRTTVIGPRAGEGDPDAYDVASVYADTPDGPRMVRIAGGAVPVDDPGFAVSYTFPDGHVEPAVLGVDAQGRGWWRMVYAAVPTRGNETRQPPIQVAVTQGGATTTTDLEWGSDTCAQANHGC